MSEGLRMARGLGPAGGGETLRLVRQLGGLVWRSARLECAGTLALSTLLSLTEGVSLALIFPLIGMLGDPAHTAARGGRYAGLVFRLLRASHLPASAWLGAVLVGLLLTVGVLTQMNALVSALTVRIILRVRRQLAVEMYRHILEADWVQIAGRRTSDLTHLLSSELDRVAQVTGSLYNGFGNAAVALLMVGVAVYLAPLLTLGVVVCFALLLAMQRRTSRAILRSGQDLSGKVAEVFGSTVERVQNLKVVQAYGAQEAELALYEKRYGAVLQELLHGAWIRNVAGSWFQIASLMLLCGVVLVGLNVLHLSASAVLVFCFAFFRLTPRVTMLQGNVNEVLADVPAYGAIRRFLDESEPVTAEIVDEAETIPVLLREVRLEGVSFRYGRGALVLDGVSLEIAAGKITAIAGFSGAGKSTAADLVMGLLAAESGAVTVDGVQLTRGNARAWRRQVGYVSQDTLLFHEGIRENLLWARPGASEAELWAALREARAEFVEELPRGIDTVVGDRGLMLSHGQRQRIALARALLLRPALLILDEATNSLDEENEAAILDAVRGRTVLLISHRASAVRFADKVFLLRDGRVSGEVGGW